MKILRINLKTSNLQALWHFYSSVMELPVDTGQSMILINIGSTDLIFNQASLLNPTYHFAINIPSNKILEAREWLKKKSIELIWLKDYKSDIADFVNWHAKSVYFFDPVGNILELIARFDLNYNAHEPFSSKQFLSVSEIGLVYDQKNLERKTSELTTLYKLSFFNKQPPLPEFKAVGDDEGLFIIVPEHRNWYSTNKPAGIFPMEIKFENAGNEYRLEVK